MTAQDPTVRKVLKALALDVTAHKLADWERGFVMLTTAQKSTLSRKQMALLVRLAEEHCDPILAAELRRQEEK